MIKLTLIKGRPHIQQYPYSLPIEQRVIYTLHNIIPERAEYVKKGYKLSGEAREKHAKWSFSKLYLTI